MSYKSTGAVGLGVALVLGPFAILSAFMVFTFLAMFVYSIVTLHYGYQEVRPGSVPGRCSTWGHDWHPQLPGLPPGTTCRNCLRRRDRSALAVRGAGSFGVSEVVVPWAQVKVPLETWGDIRKRLPPRFILVEPGFPQVRVKPGVPVVMPPLPAAGRAPAPAPRPAVDFAAPSAPLPRARVVEDGPAEALCPRCFAVVGRGAARCPSCGAPV